MKISVWRNDMKKKCRVSTVTLAWTVAVTELLNITAVICYASYRSAYILGADSCRAREDSWTIAMNRYHCNCKKEPSDKDDFQCGCGLNLSSDDLTEYDITIPCPGESPLKCKFAHSRHSIHRSYVAFAVLPFLFSQNVLTRQGPPMLDRQKNGIEGERLYIMSIFFIRQLF